MKKIILSLLFITFSIAIYSQESEDDYIKFVTKADSLFKIKDFKNAAINYSDAFKTINWKAYEEDRYNAICSWAQAGVPDSAISNLNRLIGIGGYTNFDKIKTEPLFIVLYNDKRWQSILIFIKNAEAKYNKPLKRILDSIFIEDQKYRQIHDSIRKKYGSQSQEDLALWKIINKNDSLNLIVVKEILSKYGWLGKEELGQTGNSTLFLVIQHADLKTQEAYIPMMKNAVKDGKAKGSQLALLIDRIEMRNGRKQIYGSQVQGTDDGGYKLYPIEDEKNVDKRRTEMGLQKLAEYLKYYEIEYILPTGE